MNLVPARIDAGAVLLGGTALATGVQLPPGEVTLGFRPEDLVPGARGLVLAVSYVEELGASRLIHGTHDGVPILAAAASDAPLGASMSFGVRPEHLHYFDPRSGMRC
jgi:sn-glycerol 3-phosphate transport system ATP-binding protein